MQAAYERQKRGKRAALIADKGDGRDEFDDNKIQKNIHKTSGGVDLTDHIDRDVALAQKGDAVRGQGQDLPKFALQGAGR